MPPSPEGYGTDQVDASGRYVWEIEMKEVIRNKQIIANRIQQLYALVLGQCTDSMVVRVDAHSNYEQAAEDRDGLALLRIVKSICFNFQDQKYVPQSIYEAKQRFYSLKQGRHETVAQYYDKYQNNVQVLEQCSATIGNETGVRNMVCKELQICVDTNDADERKIVVTKTKDRILAIGFILGADKGRYSGMVRGFENAYTTGRDEWTKTLADAHRTLTKWKRKGPAVS